MDARGGHCRASFAKPDAGVPGEGPAPSLRPPRESARVQCQPDSITASPSAAVTPAAAGGADRQNGSRPFEPVIGQTPAHDLARPPAIHGPAGSHGAKRLELAGERLVAGVFGEYPVVVCPAAGAAFLL